MHKQLILAGSPRMSVKVGCNQARMLTSLARSLRINHRATLRQHGLCATARRTQTCWRRHAWKAACAFGASRGRRA